MKTRKTVTDKVISANRENAKKAHGATTQRGKEFASQNATKHGILAQNIRFRSDQEEASFNTLMSELRRGTNTKDDPLQLMLVEELAVAHLRRGRALRLEQKQLQRRNPATELAFNTAKKSEMLGTTGMLFLDSESGWEATELTVAAKQQGETQLRNGPLANRRGDGKEIELHVKFQDPMEKALRYQNATSRDFYRALRLVYELRKDRSRNRPN